MPYLKKRAADKSEPCTELPHFCRRGFLDIAQRIYNTATLTDHGLRQFFFPRALKETAERSASYIPYPLLKVEKAVKSIPNFAHVLPMYASGAHRVCITCQEMMTKGKILDHEDDILKCRKCCQDARDQKTQAEVALAQTNAAPDPQPAWIDVDSCAFVRLAGPTAGIMQVLGKARNAHSLYE